MVARTLTLKGIKAPASKKNRRVIANAGGRPRLIPSAEARNDEKGINAAAIEAGGLRVMFPTEDVAVDVVFHAKSKTIDVEVTAVGDRPKGFTGRRRDLHGMFETLADALEGAAYANDNQVASVTMRRVLD